MLPTAMQSAAKSAAKRSPSPWQWSIPREQTRSISPPMKAASRIPDGTYVTALGSGNTLFRVQNERRQLIEPTEIMAMGIAQNDIQEVDPFVLRTMPLEVTRRSAIGRDLQTHLWSDLKSGHFMQSWVWLQGTTLTVRTQTETVTWFGGYTGGVSIVLFDAGGNRILHDEIRFRYGVDGRAFGSGLRDEAETIQLPQDVADAAESILILHYWDPRVDLVRLAIEIGKAFFEVLAYIFEQQQKGEPVNAGGEEF